MASREDDSRDDGSRDDVIDLLSKIGIRHGCCLGLWFFTAAKGSHHMPESVYRQRDPQNTPFYLCVEEHIDAFEQVYEECFERQYGFFRPYVRQVIYRYLDCGVLENGFARLRCDDCGHEYLLAYSCKRRHFCPSCHQKRVVEFGEWLCGTSSRPCTTGTWCSASPRSCAGIFCTTASCCPL
jgi:hypothetical protein